MMDLDNFTIPPELFYSTKTTGDSWKPIRKSTPAPPPKRRKVLTKKLTTTSKKYKITRLAPELGRIGKIKRTLIKKKLIQKKPEKFTGHKFGVPDDHQLIDKENRNNNNASVKPLTKQEERVLIKEMKAEEQALTKKIYATSKPQKKRPKGSSFKFFKSKNTSGEEEEEESFSGSDDDLVPEIRDYSDSQSSPTSASERKKFSPKKSHTALVLDPAPFEDGSASEDEHEGTTIAIESLLKNLVATPHKKPEETYPCTLDGLIETLEGGPAPEKPVKRVRFMGLGDNQLQLDAGQKKFGIVECKECGFSYNTNVPEDEKIHNKHHLAVTTIPRFRGWANEDSMTVNEWSEQGGRIIHLQPNDKNISSDYVKEIIKSMEMEFGVQDDYQRLHVYLAVHDMKIVAVATVKDYVMACNEALEISVRLGVQRLFVRPEFRRKGFAKTLLKTIVIMHQKGELFDLKTDVAFSSPTEDGKKLITSVVGSDKYFTFTS